MDEIAIVRDHDCRFTLWVLVQCRPCVADITRSCLKGPQLELYKREAMWGQDGFVSIYVPKGIAKVSLRVDL